MKGKKIDYVKQGKRNLASGRRFELKVREDLESKGWIVSRWQNNVEWLQYASDGFEGKDNSNLRVGKCIQAKQGRFRKTSTGFPDFIAFTPNNWHFVSFEQGLKIELGKSDNTSIIIGVEAKSNGYLKPEEKEKCAWYLKEEIFSKILIAKKGTKRGEIEYIEFK